MNVLIKSMHSSMDQGGAITRAAEVGLFEDAGSPKARRGLHTSRSR